MNDCKQIAESMAAEGLQRRIKLLEDVIAEQQKAIVALTEAQKAKAEVVGAIVEGLRNAGL